MALTDVLFPQGNTDATAESLAGTLGEPLDSLASSTDDGGEFVSELPEKVGGVSKSRIIGGV